MDTPKSPLEPSPIYQRVVSVNAEAERAMRMIAESNAAHYKDALRGIIEGVAPAFIERHPDVQLWPGAQWGQAQISEVIQLAREYVYQQMKDSRMQQLERERDEARSQAAALARQVRELDEQLAVLQKLVSQRGPIMPARANKGLASEPQPPVENAVIAPDNAGAAILVRPEKPYTLRLQIPALPDWWQYSSASQDPPRDFAKKALALGLLGETGISSRKWLERTIATASGYGRSTINRLIEALETLQWIEILGKSDKRDKRKTEETWLPHAIRLTQAGKEVFRKIFQVEPVESEFDRLQRGHSNATEHTLLCIGAADQFRRRGAEVECMPAPIQIESVCSFQPDLSVQAREGECDVWLVECERGEGPAGKANEHRLVKWQNSFLIQGAVYLVAPDPDVRVELVQEILKLGKRGKVYATDMVMLQQKNDEFWVEVRESR